MVEIPIPERIHITGAKTNIKRTITPWNKWEVGIESSKITVTLEPFVSRGTSNSCMTARELVGNLAGNFMTSARVKSPDKRKYLAFPSVNYFEKLQKIDDIDKTIWTTLHLFLTKMFLEGKRFKKKRYFIPVVAIAMVLKR